MAGERRKDFVDLGGGVANEVRMPDATEAPARFFEERLPFSVLGDQVPGVGLVVLRAVGFDGKSAAVAVGYDEID